MIELKNPELLLVTDGSGIQTTGGDQYWYPKEGYIPPGACGATVGANLLCYVLRSRPELYVLGVEAGLTGLAPPLTIGLMQSRNAGLNRIKDVDSVVCGIQKPGGIQTNSKDEYLDFMKEIYRFLYPRIGGLMADGFLEGMRELALEYKLPIDTMCLKVPIARSNRPGFSEASAFIRASLECDMPVAFLILSSGFVANLDTWHWVTILALDEKTKSIQITDNGKPLNAELNAWLDKSIMGGAFVRLQVKNE